MVRGLKITMGAFGAILVIEGILDLIVPAQRAAGLGLGESGARAQLVLAILGASWIVTGGGILAAARDPMRHPSWIKLALAFPLALLLALLASVLVGEVALGEVMVDLAFNALFATLLLIFYPRGANAARAYAH